MPNPPPVLIVSSTCLILLVQTVQSFSPISPSLTPLVYKHQILSKIKKIIACVNLQVETGKQVAHGLKQADGLAPTLSNSASQHATRKRFVGTRWTLEQILEYANDINIMARSMRYVRGRVEELAIAGEYVG